MKKILTVFMAITMVLLSGSFNSFVSCAEEAVVVVQEEQYQEITDPYELLEMALQQSESIAMRYAVKEESDSDDVSVTQLIAERTLSDGTQEKQYATTSLLILDENDQKVGMTQLIESNATIENSGSITSSGGNYNLVVSCTAYWEWKKENGVDYARCTHTTNQVVGNTSGQYSVTQLDCAFRASNDIWTEPTYIDHVYINYPTPYVTYTATNPRQTFFNDAPYFAEIAAGVVITYSDGTTYEIYIDVKAAAQG